jgi:selenocysteine lyase/cysteine desulfurase
MINAWRQREMRNGIKLVWIDLPLPMNDEDEIVNYFTSAFTKRTKVVQLTHMINWTGQIMPAKKITAAAHSKGIEVILDAAHTFAQIPVSFHELDVDYAGTSLHKWLGAPFGNGLLYVKKEKIQQIYPLLGSEKPLSSDIRKFESLGTRSFPSEMSIATAIDLHELIGLKRKSARMRKLKDYWVKRIKDIPGIHLHTPLSQDFANGLSMFSIEGKTPAEIEKRLFDDFHIHITPINWGGLEGIRVTPHLYTTEEELDKLVEAIQIIQDK